MTRRLLNSDLSYSEKFNKPMSNFARILYALLIAHSDPWGRGEADPHTIKIKVVPGLPETTEEVEAAMTSLREVKLVYWYSDGEKRYYEIIDNEKQQNLDSSKRGKRSRYPDIDPDDTEQALIGPIRPYQGNIGTKGNLSKEKEKNLTTSLSGIKKIQKKLKGGGAE